MKRFVSTCLMLVICLNVFAKSQERSFVDLKYKRVLDKKAEFGLAKFPIGFWNYTNLDEHLGHQQESDVKQWFQAGFTLPKSPGFDPKNKKHVKHINDMLGWCRKYDMKMVLVDKRSLGLVRSDEGVKLPDDFGSNFSSAVNDFGGHPALFGFSVGDEPDKSNGEAYFEAYKVQKKLAPGLFPFMNLLPYWGGAEDRVGYNSWDEYLDAVASKSGLDFFSFDCYTQMGAWRGWDGYYENLRLYRDASLRNGIPYWVTLLSTGHYGYRCPDYYDLKMQFNTALCGGASGIDWFFYYMRKPHSNYRFSPVDEFWETTQTYHDLRKIHNSFHKRYGGLFNGLVSTKVMFFPKGKGGFEDFSPDSLIAEIEMSQTESETKTGSIMLGEFLDKDGNRYVMIVNDTEKISLRPTIKLVCENAKIFIWNWNGQKQFNGRGNKGFKTVTQWLGPGQEMFYCIEPDRRK